MAKAKKKRRKATGVKKKVTRAKKRKPVKRRRSPAKKRRTRRVIGVKRKPAKKRKRRSPGRKLVKQVERRSVERVMAGKRRRRRAVRKRRVVMAGRPRRRAVGKKDNSKLLIGLAIGAAAIYFLTKKTTTATYPTNYQLPPIAQTSNYTRNTQSQDLLNYAMAGGLAIEAIIKLIDKLNTSSDQEVENIYDVYHTTGNLNYIA